ncbi:hypothetical protein INR49_004388 [Xyrichtys novacula]|uniref:Uncharacterized protein n=1 Tax=Xyrichtys novacula TaxID=13765 RepID=A0AAV1GVZ0_XYRNO|nr:hypothetical protein INR49_004388 [Xyrichtys novacula]
MSVRSTRRNNSPWTMAPLGMVDLMGWASTPEVGIISLIVFLVLSVTLVALCARCHRGSGNAYDINGTTNEGADGMDDTKTGGADPAYSNWRDHKLPPNTLERNAQAQAAQN